MNDKVKNIQIETLSNNWYTLKKVSYDYLKSNGTWQPQTREVYDREMVLVYYFTTKSKKK